MSRKLVLHVDVNQTITASDGCLEMGPEKALNTFIAGVVWGRERSSEKNLDNGLQTWQWSSLETSLKAPNKHDVSYYSYLESKLTDNSNTSDRSKMRSVLENFTNTPQGNPFKQAVNKLKESLLWKFPDNQTDVDFVISSPESGEIFHFILPSFIRLLYSLEEKHKDFAVILRTFGEDSERVLRCLQKIGQGLHPMFPKSLSMEVLMEPGFINRSGPFELEVSLLKRRRAYPVPLTDNRGLVDCVNCSSYLTQLYQDNCNVSDPIEDNADGIEDLEDSQCNTETFLDNSGIMASLTTFQSFRDTMSNVKPNQYQCCCGSVNGNVLGSSRSEDFLVELNLPIRQNTLTNNTKIITSKEEFYESLNSVSGIAAIKDDYTHWKKFDFSAEAGKPFVVDVSDQFYHHIFLDDNARIESKDSIIDVHVLTDTLEDPAILLEDIFIVKANLLESITNLNYFVDSVETCERNYSNYLCESSC